jgi:hypothetical protein
MRRFFIFIFLLTNIISAQPYLTGELKGLYHKDNYTITGNIYVNPGDTLVFEEGSRLQFEPFTGIIVRGTFIAEGTKNKPIVFTSTKDQWPMSGSVTTLSSFDWNGIKVADSNSVLRLSYSMLSYGTMGIDIKYTASDVVLHDIVFHRNGYMNLIRDNKFVDARDDVEYTFGWTRQKVTELRRSKELFPSVLQQAAYTGTENRHHINIGKEIVKKVKSRPFRLTMGGLAACGAGLWIYGHVRAEHYDSEYHRQDDATEAIRISEKRDDMVKIRNAGIWVCGVSSAFLGVTFLF